MRQFRVLPTVLLFLGCAATFAPPTGDDRDNAPSVVKAPASAPASPEHQGATKGRARITHRGVQKITGGKTSAPGTWPFAVALLYQADDNTYHQYCGGSLITPTLVVTAAHCKVSLEDVAIVGFNDLRTGLRDIRKIISFVPYSEYNSDAHANDIALLKLAPAVAPSTLPVELASEATALPDGSTVTVIGWGSTSEGGKSSLRLQEADVKVVNAATCKSQYRGEDNILDSMLCAANDRKDSCQGDSGGPLLYARGFKKVQVGVVSFGKGCGRPGHSGVYTRTSSFRPWIDDVMRRGE